MLMMVQRMQHHVLQLELQMMLLEYGLAQQTISILLQNQVAA
jgi:hypothetical protein